MDGKYKHVKNNPYAAFVFSTFALKIIKAYISIRRSPPKIHEQLSLVDLRPA